MSFVSVRLHSLCGVCLLMFGTSVQASDHASLTPGKPAPATVVEQLENSVPVHIGKHALRPVTPPQDARRLQSTFTPAASSTPVVRDGDNLVGISHHELTVRGVDPHQIRTLVASLLPTATTTAYPDLELTIIRTQRFSDLAPLAAQLAESLPDARFDLPVQWAPVRPR